MVLDPIQIRVLGALMEKEIATPETYPLSLNALLAACNQRSSRDPVMELTEEQVRQALHGLDDLGLTSTVRDSRVPKYEHRIRTVLNLRRDETAVLCLLLLRGPQTPGELRARADRLYTFDGLDAVESTLDRLMKAVPLGDSADARIREPIAMMLPRQPGSREARYAHLLGGQPAVNSGSERDSVARSESEGDLPYTRSSDGAHSPSVLAARIASLEGEVEALRSAIVSIEARLSASTDSALRPPE